VIHERGMKYLMNEIDEKRERRITVISCGCSSLFQLFKKTMEKRRKEIRER
jgi:hypothetical protein